MFIKSIIIDGFKSYGTRTEIKGFDQEFNAITGLNGTGKSNILDSICFVLGISNLAHVRAANVQELIYKCGQAGVSKATVTIVFDNTDPSKSPINYEQYSELTVTRQVAQFGKNRYMINGVSVSNKQVGDFFNSIQLNVNNPHFLIMQGRITKVLNMKPPEILSMIEEAAGTRMYENKKIIAQKTIDKKDVKVQEMNEMVTGQINPKMERLRKERSHYIEHQKIQRDLEHYSRIHIAHTVIKTEKYIEEEKIENAKRIEAYEESLKRVSNDQTEIDNFEENIKQSQLARDKEGGGTLEKLESQLKEAHTTEAKALSLLKMHEENISSEIDHQKSLENSLKEDEKALNVKQAVLDGTKDLFDQLREEEKKDSEAFDRAQDKFQKVSQGLLANDDGQDTTLQEQLMAAKQIATEKETAIKQYTVEIKYLKEELITKKPLLKNTEIKYIQDKKSFDVKEKELNNLRNEFNKLNYQEGSLESLQESMKSLNHEIKQCSGIIDKVNVCLPLLHFQYTDPEPNFDRRKIRGVLCKLFKVKDKKFARALETAAAAKLYNVVVDNESVSSKLIEKGQLLRRTTFAPLNKVQGKRMPSDLIQKAKQLVGEDNVFPAQSLIEYKPEYEHVMSWVFGQVFVCDSIDAAEKVSSSSNVRKRAITLDGDVFDPNGIVSGGAAEKKPPVLLAMIEGIAAEENRMKKNKELEKLNKEVQQLMPIASKYEAFKQKIDSLTREFEIVSESLKQTTHCQLQQELETIQQNISERETKMKECKKEIDIKNAKVAELEHKCKNLKSFKETALKEAEAEMNKLKNKFERSKKNWKLKEQEAETIKLEVDELKAAVQKCKDEILKSKETVSLLKEEVKTREAELKQAQSLVKEMAAQVKSEKDCIGQKNKEIRKMIEQKEKLNKIVSEIKLQMVKDDHKIKLSTEQISSAEKHLQELNKKHRWVVEDREFFGQPNGMYDFEANDPDEAKRQLDKLKEAQAKLGKHTNTKMMDVLSTQEDQFAEVMKKKVTVEEDKVKILDVIEKLDKKKEEVVCQAWEQVNRDFNSILGSLLPGAHAKLKPMNLENVMEGLEVKVGFGGIWKDSLDELSGGQRSLVALSLILAMLLFKPAPLYILDEVDAALDPSHTQNIGQMLKTHFKQSQFIVVSLKDGMFNNANVLFRTSFVDGMSTVHRTTNNRN